jgi:hypothetical protein
VSEPAVRVAIAAVRAWTRLYTCGLPKADGAARRDEIESDLWEGTHDPDRDRGRLPLQIWARLVCGVFDDVRWRAAQVTDAGVYAWRLAVTLVLAMLLGLWLVNAATPPPWQAPPPPQPGPVLLDVPPPPPPPPPCLPAGLRDPGVKCVR